MIITKLLIKGIMIRNIIITSQTAVVIIIKAIETMMIERRKDTETMKRTIRNIKEEIGAEVEAQDQEINPADRDLEVLTMILKREDRMIGIIDILRARNNLRLLI